MHRFGGSTDSLPSIPSTGYGSNTRRMTQPSLYPPLPDANTNRSQKRSGSPLRQSITASPRSEDGSPLVDRYDQGSWGNHYGYEEEQTSPTLGALARVASSIVSSLKSPPLKPTDDEIEAQAIRDREYSRREAERILTREAEERRVMEEKILAMRANGRSSSQTSLPLPSAPDTSGGSPGKEDRPGWWRSAKERLTPTRELTPAQQIIQDTKKDQKKGKGKEPRTPTKKMSDPSILHLDIPRDGGYSQNSSSPTQERGSRPTSSTGHNRAISPAGKSGKDGENTPLYVKFTPLGALDVPETVLTLAKRFEKLERWTVGHVRALEDRVGDVEKWLVDKEEARQTAEDARGRDAAESKRIMDEMRSKGDELKRLAEETSRNSQHSTREIRQTVKSEVENAVANIRMPSTQSEVTRSDLQRINSEISSVKEGLTDLKSKFTEFSRSASNKTAERSRSPTPLVAHNTGGRSRLPYPSGDYASGDGITPPASPPPTNGSARMVTSPSSILPPLSATLYESTSSTSLNRDRQQSSNSYTSSLPPPTTPTPRASSTSPTPRNRKRYTVALGGSLTSPLDQLAQDFEDANKDAEPALPSGDSPSGVKLIGSSAFSRDSPSPNHGREETIGGTPIDLARVSTLSPPGSLSASFKRGQDSSPGSSRIRAQSAYGAPTGWDSMSKNIADTQPLRPRRRSGDLNGEFGALGANGSGSATGSANKFVDPLLLRKKDSPAPGAPRLAVPRGKTSFGDLLAFFDGDKK